VGIVVAVGGCVEVLCSLAHSARVPARSMKQPVKAWWPLASNWAMARGGLRSASLWIKRLASQPRPSQEEAIEDVGGDFRAWSVLSVSSIRSRKRNRRDGGRTASLNSGSGRADY